LTKVRPVGATLTDAETDRQTDGRTDITKVINAFHDMRTSLKRN